MLHDNRPSIHSLAGLLIHAGLLGGKEPIPAGIGQGQGTLWTESPVYKPSDSEMFIVCLVFAVITQLCVCVFVCLFLDNLLSSVATFVAVVGLCLLNANNELRNGTRALLASAVVRRPFKGGMKGDGISLVTANYSMHPQWEENNASPPHQLPH